MRWYCLSPSLPSQAVLRIRVAPNSSAPECGRLSEGKAVAALSDIFEIEDDGSIQRWLPVTFPDAISEDSVEGFMMATTPTGMELLVPWEETAFISCCTIANGHATLYDSPSDDAHIVDTIKMGEATQFPFGISETRGHRVRVFYRDAYLWLDAIDTEPVCERLHHPNCTAPHSFFTLNETLPEGAQIAIRGFPSREAETVALLSRGQVIEVVVRSGNWLQLAGQPDSWIMWHTGAMQLLVEIPAHTSVSCGTSSAHEYPENTEEAALGEAPQVELAYTEQQQPSLMEAAVESSTVNDQDTNRRIGDEDPIIREIDVAEYVTPTEQREVAAVSQHESQLQQEPANSDAIADEVYSVDGTIGVTSVATPSVDGEDLPRVAIPWDERPLDVKPSQPSDANVSPNTALPWDERPLNIKQPQPQESTMDDPPSSLLPWDERPLNVKSREMSDADEESQMNGASNTTLSWDERPLNATQHQPTNENEESAMDCPPNASLPWDERPLNVKPRELSDADEMNGPPSASLPWDERPLNVKPRELSDADEMDAPSSTSLPWDERPLNVEQSQPPDADEASEMEMTHTAEPTPNKVLSWEDQPLMPKSRGTYDWEASAGLSPEKLTVVQDQPAKGPEEAPQHQDEYPDARVGYESQHNETSVTSTDDDQPCPPSPVVDSQPSQRTSGAFDATSVVEAVATGGDDEQHIEAANKEPKEWHWEEAPIKSRHAVRVAQDAESKADNVSMSVATINQDASNHSDNAWRSTDKFDAKSSPFQRFEEKKSDQDTEIAVVEEPGEHSSPVSHPSPVVGVVAANDFTVAWHSIAAAEDEGVFDGCQEEKEEEEAPAEQPSLPKLHLPSHSPVGVVAAHHLTVAWHTTDANEDPGVFDEPEEKKSHDVLDEDSSVNSVTRTLFGANEDVDSSDGEDQDQAMHEAAVQQDEEKEDCGANDMEVDVSDDPVTALREEIALEASKEEHETDGDSLMAASNRLEDENQLEDVGELIEVDGDDGDDSNEEGVDDRSVPHDPPSDVLMESEPIRGIENGHVDAFGGNAHTSTQQSTSSLFAAKTIDQKLKEKLSRLSTDHPGYRVFKAIAMEEEVDVILEALSSTGDGDIGWVASILRVADDAPMPAVETPDVASATPAVHVPSPSTSESALLDVLYSRGDGDGYSTPKKTKPSAPTPPPTPYSAEGVKTRHAGFLHRTPQKVTESYTMIVNNANPDDILAAEFGAMDGDELGLFGDYRYPTMSTMRFLSGQLSTPTRGPAAAAPASATDAMPSSGLLSPSFSSASFASPVPKENPLKRSAAAIAKTPPVRSVSAVAAATLPKPLTTTVTTHSKPVAAAPTAAPKAVAQHPAPVLARTRTASSLLPPSTSSVRTPTALPRPSLMAPPIATSQLRRPAASSMASPTPSAVSRVRSLTSSEDPRPTGVAGSATSSTKATVPSPGLARTQSMLPRKTMLAAPSPTKFGLNRTGSAAATTSRMSITARTTTGAGSAAPPAQPSSDNALLERRLSFGFSRPTATKK